MMTMPERTLNAIKAATDTKALAGGAVSFGGFMVVLTDIMPLLGTAISLIVGLITIIYLWKGIQIRNEELQMLKRQNSALNAVDHAAQKIKSNNS